MKIKRTDNNGKGWRWKYAIRDTDNCVIITSEDNSKNGIWKESLNIPQTYLEESDALELARFIFEIMLNRPRTKANKKGTKDE